MHFSTHEFLCDTQKVYLCGPGCKEALEHTRTNVPGLKIWKSLGSYRDLLPEPHSACLSVFQRSTYDPWQWWERRSLSLPVLSPGDFDDKGLVYGTSRKKAPVVVHWKKKMGHSFLFLVVFCLGSLLLQIPDHKVLTLLLFVLQI